MISPTTKKSTKAAIIAPTMPPTGSLDVDEGKESAVAPVVGEVDEVALEFETSEPYTIASKMKKVPTDVISNE